MPQSFFMIKAVLFDLDNTLMDFMKMKRRAVEAAVEAMAGAGLRVGKKRAERILWSLYAKKGFEYQRIFQLFLKKMIGKIDYSVMAAGIVAYRHVKEGYVEPYPGVVDALLKLREGGIRLGIITDAPKLQAWLRLAEMKLTPFFDLVIAFEDTGRKKPSAMPFEEAVKKLGLEPGEILFVGDSLKRDVAGAKKAGMVAAWAKYGESREGGGARPDYVISSPRQLVGIVRKLL